MVPGAPASNGKQSANDVYVINTDCIEKITIVSEHVPTEIVRPIDFTKVSCTKHHEALRAQVLDNLRTVLQF